MNATPATEMGAGKILSSAVVSIFDERRVQESRAQDPNGPDRSIAGLIGTAETLVEKLGRISERADPDEHPHRRLVAISLAAVSMRLVEAIEREVV